MVHLARVLMIGCALTAVCLGDEPGLKFPATEKLPAIHELPDPFLMNSGKRVSTAADWQQRRGEIRDMILTYEYGHIPSDPGTVKATQSSSDQDATSGAKIEQLALGVGPDAKVTTHLVLTIPTDKGPFPVIITGDLGWGRVKPPIVQEINRRGYMLAEFNRTEIAADKNDRSVGIYPLYPDYDWGDLAAWAWGYSRVIDYLQTRNDVDHTKITVTGHSRGGKAALLAGALDERIALTVPNGSGAGGAGCFRIQWPLTEDLQAISTHFPYWFSPHFDDFIGHVDQLPFDQHEVKALVAPRALLTTDSLDDLWANPLGTQVSYLASKQIFEFLGVPEKTGLHYRRGPHAQNQEDWNALLDFADWQLRAKQPAQKFDELPFPQTPPAYKWTTPRPAGESL